MATYAPDMVIVPLKVREESESSGNNLEVNLAAIDAPGGFLFEWWSVFWDIFIARTNEKHSEAAAAYIEVALNLYTFALLVKCSLDYMYAKVNRILLPFILLEMKFRLNK